MKLHQPIRRAAALCLLLAIAASLFLPFAQAAEKKTVRVGWFESPFESTDKYGRRSGYAYEYQQEIAAYTGWEYEYVNGNWTALLEMLERGEIDLLSDVSYTAEREEKMLFSSMPMGTETYLLYAAAEDLTIKRDDYGTLSGKTVGVNASSRQAELYRAWAEKNGVDATVRELTCSEKEAIGMLERGEINLFVTLDFDGNDTDRLRPISKIGTGDFYFAVNRERPDLLSDLNSAMSRLSDANPSYGQQLYLKYFRASGFNQILDNAELSWLISHGPIRVGYQDNYLAFCAKDPETGALTGALKDYLAFAEDAFENAHPHFEAVAYPTAAAMMDALKSGRVDCVFPANLTDYDGETLGVFSTAPIMNTDLSAVVREADRRSFRPEQSLRVAVNEGNPNYEMFLGDYFPQWKIVHFADTRACLEAIAAGEADCLLISNYRYNNIAADCRRLSLVSLSTGVEMSYSFAIRRDGAMLYSILSKIINFVPQSPVNAALSYYYSEDAGETTLELLNRNLVLILGIAAVVLLAIVLLLWRYIRAQKRISVGRQLISATETDPLTGLYTKGYFHAYAARMHRRNPDRAMDAVVLDIEQFHAVNTAYGRAFGDRVLCELAAEIKAFLAGKNGIASRIEGDRFGIYCPHLHDPRLLFDRLQSRIDAVSSYAGIRLRMGVTPWGVENNPAQAFDNAHTACILARGSYREHLVVFNDAVRQKEARGQRLLADLRRAIEENEFAVYYQPKYDIRVAPPKLVGAEALVRWNHPELGLIRPDEFIPLLEKDGRITELDRWVWSEAAKQAACWRREFGVQLSVSVNLSRIDALDPALPQMLDALLRENGLDSSALHVEITESAYIENSEQIVPVITALRSMGLQIELDDFGSGYSSLGALSAMPIDVLKMDQSFVRSIEHSEKDARLVALILGIAEDLHVPVVAEGVETPSQLQLLRQMGCQMVQGYCLSRPLDAEAFEKQILGQDGKPS